MQIKGHLALISGGASGLGAATAKFLAAQGAKVAILDFDEERGDQHAGDIDGAAFQTDVSNADSVGAALDAAIAHFGQAPRIVVNCAGIVGAARVVGREGKLAIENFQRTISVNLVGTYNVMSYAVRAMQAADPLDTGERGVVINTASAAYEDGQIGQAAYAASKGGIAAMSLPVAREFAKTGIRCVTIAPGLFATPMMESLPTEVTEKITSDIQFPARLGDPAEFGQMVAQIVENPYLNGTTIRLDGAVRLPPK